MNRESDRYDGLPSARMSDDEVFAVAERKMEQDKRYLDPVLTMEAMAAEMGIHRNRLSRAVNKLAGKSFPLWLAEYRVAEAERLATLPGNEQLRISDIAYESGFTSHSSFYRTFVKLRHAKPSFLLENHAADGAKRSARAHKKR